jgi:succinate dehydrogenase / fumarate reductase iron-sulfur subunit
MKITLRVWRQKDGNSKGKFEEYVAEGLNPNMSFLEMLDVVNENLNEKGEEPIAFAHDCREGICGTCSCMINGKPHGPENGATTCQTYMRSFKDGDVILVEPFRAKAFPVQKDLITDRSAFDSIIQSGGYITARAGSCQDANGCGCLYRLRGLCRGLQKFIGDAFRIGKGGSVELASPRPARKGFTGD